MAMFPRRIAVSTHGQGTQGQAAAPSITDPWALVDGRGAAPPGTPQFPTILNQLPNASPPNARVRWPTTTNGPQPPWKVAGVDYAVGMNPNATITSGSPTVINETAHGHVANDQMTFYVGGGGSLPSGMVIGTTYFVISAGLTTNSYQISATSGGSALATSGTSSLVIALKDPTTNALPSGSVYQATPFFTVLVNGAGSITVTLDHWDFTVSGGIGVNVDNAFVGTINCSNNNFKIGANANPMFNTSLCQCTAMNVTYSVFDTNAIPDKGNIGANLGVQGTNVVVQYCYFNKWDGRTIVAIGNTGQENFLFQYNLAVTADNYAGAGLYYPSTQNVHPPPAFQHQHCDVFQLLGGCASLKAWFNTTYQPGADATTGLPGSQNGAYLHSDGTKTTNNIDLEYNTWHGVGDNQGGGNPHANGATNSTSGDTNGSPNQNLITNIADWIFLTGDFGTLGTAIVGAHIYSSSGDIPPGTTVTAVNVAGNSLTMSAGATGVHVGQHIFVWLASAAGGTTFGGGNVAGVMSVIVNATWAATSGGQITFTTAAVHGFSVGDILTVLSVNPPVFNGIYTAVTGTVSGTTTIVVSAANPGLPYVSGGTIGHPLTNFTVANNFVNIGAAAPNSGVTLSDFGLPTGPFVINATFANNINMFDGSSLPHT